MKLQSILLLTGIAAGLMTASCQSSTQAEAEAFNVGLDSIGDIAYAITRLHLF